MVTRLLGDDHDTVRQYAVACAAALATVVQQSDAAALVLPLINDASKVCRGGQGEEGPLLGGRRGWDGMG